jgi:hypothetical protein
MVVAAGALDQAGPSFSALGSRRTLFRDESVFSIVLSSGSVFWKTRVLEPS